MNSIFLIFSGFNSRAVFSLCRSFVSAEVPFAIVAESKNDIIHKSSFAKRVILTRKSPSIDIKLLNNILNQLPHASRIVICPSSEFLNQTLLSLRSLMPESFTLPLVSSDLYSVISNKTSGLHFFVDSLGVRAPRVFPKPPSLTDIPFVAKPKRNIMNGRTLYPLLVNSESSYMDRYQALEKDNYFFQEYVDGQSIYCCYYFSFDTKSHSTFIQENLCQQPNGGSIIWARPGQSDHAEIAEHVANKLSGAMFQGWIMVELMLASGAYYFIEANPRLWGPLQLCIDTAPDLMNTFLGDFSEPVHRLKPATPCEYFWEDGLKPYVGCLSRCRWYTERPSNSATFISSMAQHDIFRKTTGCMQSER